MPGLRQKRSYYKPLDFEWAHKAWETQNNMHWLQSEVPMNEDISDWNLKLTDKEKNLLTQLFRFFTQADLDIAGGYVDKYLPIFQNPDIRMMLLAFASMESTHIAAYSLLLDTIGMPEAEYKAFQEYEDMKAKHEYLEGIKVDSDSEIAKSIAVFSAFGEGLQLFSSFAMLLNFPRMNKMKGMGQIVSYSLKDEDLHVNSMIKLFHAFLDENPKLWKASLKKEIYQAARDMVDLEDKFIDLAYSAGEVEGLSPGEVKEYIRFIADKRLIQLGLKPEYKIKENPLPWIDWMMSAVVHENFFEVKAVEYSRCGLEGSWDEVWADMDALDK